MKKIIIAFLLMLFIPSLLSAQRWKRERIDAYVGVGTNHFMGDLGGGAEDAAHFLGVRDIDWQKTRPTVQIGVRYRILQELAVKPTFTYAFITADDATSGSYGRYRRNLHFRAQLFELGAQFEYYFLKEKEMAKYTFASMRAINRFSAYAFVGGGGFYFEPKAELNGEWHKLRPLNTEGQGQPSYEYNGETYTPDEPYQPFAAYLSMGLGGRYKLNDRISLGLEISNRYTSTDYLDDASNRYYTSHSDPLAQALADRHIDEDGNPAPNYPTGYPMRGNPEYNDAYIFTIITGFYRFKYSMRSLPKF
jgi:hypothetical protein